MLCKAGNFRVCLHRRFWSGTQIGTGLWGHSFKEGHSYPTLNSAHDIPPTEDSFDLSFGQLVAPPCGAQSLRGIRVLPTDEKLRVRLPRRLLSRTQMGTGLCGYSCEEAILMPPTRSVHVPFPNPTLTPRGLNKFNLRNKNKLR